MISNLKAHIHNTLFYHKVDTSERNSWLITTIDDDYNSIVDPGETTQKQALLLLILAYAEKNHLSTDMAELDSNGFKYKVYYTDVCNVQPWPCICESVLCVMQPPPGLRYMVASSHTTK